VPLKGLTLLHRLLPIMSPPAILLERRGHPRTLGWTPSEVCPPARGSIPAQSKLQLENDKTPGWWLTLTPGLIAHRSWTSLLGQNVAAYL
jgi:hypothetical protein